MARGRNSSSSNRAKERKAGLAPVKATASRRSVSRPRLSKEDQAKVDDMYKKAGIANPNAPKKPKPNLDEVSVTAKRKPVSLKGQAEKARKDAMDAKLPEVKVSAKKKPTKKSEGRMSGDELADFLGLSKDSAVRRRMNKK